MWKILKNRVEERKDGQDAVSREMATSVGCGEDLNCKRLLRKFLS
jgi:hypothetical protein